MRLMAVLIVNAAMLAGSTSATAASIKVTRFELSNGMRVMVNEIPSRQALYWHVVLPAGHVHDGPNQLLWTNLAFKALENAYRSTGAAGMRCEDEIVMLSDSMPSHYSLDDMLKRVERQMKASVMYFQPAALSTEVIEESVKDMNYHITWLEEENTPGGGIVEGGIAQAIRFGIDDLSALEPIASATDTRIRAYHKRILPEPRDCLLVINGSVPADLLQPIAERVLGQLKPARAEPWPEKREREIPRKLTWDFNSRILALSWDIPRNLSIDTRAALLMLQYCLVRSRAHSDIVDLGAVRITYNHHWPGEHDKFNLIVALHDDVSFDEAYQQIETHIDQIRKGITSIPLIEDTQDQLSDLVILDSTPEEVQDRSGMYRFQGSPLAKLSWQWAYFEWVYGSERNAVGEALFDVYDEQMRDAASKYLPKESCAVFRFESRDEDESKAAEPRQYRLE